MGDHILSQTVIDGVSTVTVVQVDEPRVLLVERLRHALDSIAPGANPESSLGIHLEQIGVARSCDRWNVILVEDVPLGIETIETLRPRTYIDIAILVFREGFYF